MPLTYRPLGRTGAMVSSLCLGTMNFDDGTDEAEAERIVAKFGEAGGNFIDSANIYAGGRSEEMLGRVLSRLAQRDRFFLATKVRGRMGDQPNSIGVTRLHIVQEVESNLRRLQTDRIDLLQIHHPDPSVPIDETLYALDSLVNAGKVVYIGTSNFPAWTIVESLWVSKERHLPRFVCEQAPYNLLDRRIERDLIPMAQTYGTAVIPWGPLAGGMLSGKYRRASGAPEGSRYTNDRYRGTPVSDEVWNVIESLESLSKAKGVTSSQFALAWVQTRSGVTSPIIGPRTLNQLVDNLAASEITFSPEEESEIDNLISPGTSVKNYYGMRPSPTERW